MQHSQQHPIDDDDEEEELGERIVGLAPDNMDAEEASVPGKRPAHPAHGGKSPAHKRHSPARLGDLVEPLSSDPTACIEFLLAERRSLQQQLNERNDLVTRLMSDQSRFEERLNSMSGSVTTLQSDMAPLKGLKRDDRRIAAIDKRVGDLERNPRGSAAAAEAAAEVYQWHTPEAAMHRPTHAQITAIVGALQLLASKESSRDAIATIMCFTEGKRGEFLDGRLTVNLYDTGVLNTTLWQLWAFAVGRRSLTSCVPTAEEGDTPGALDYGSALVECSVQPPIYFGRSIAPMAPPTPRPPSRHMGVALGLPGPGAAASSSASSGVIVPFSSPCGSSTGNTPLMRAANLGMSPAPAAMARAASSLSIASTSSVTASPSAKSLREIASANAAYLARFGEEPSEVMKAAAAQFKVELSARKPAITACDTYEAMERQAKRVPDPRPADAEYPEWPHVPRAEPIDGPEGDMCHVGGEGGILTECHGCGYSFDFTKVDKTRAPPGGDVPWYCGRDDCKGSFYRTQCGWRPQSLPVETFECFVCLQTHNAGLKCELEGCTCADERMCVDCVHQLVFRLEEDETSFQCGVCKGSCTAIMRPGAESPDLISEMPHGGNNPLLESVADVVRRRYGVVTLTEQRRMEAEALEASRVHAVRDDIATGDVPAEAAAAMELAARGELDQLLQTGPIDTDRAASAKAAALGQARTKPGGRKAAAEAREARKASLEYPQPPPPHKSSPTSELASVKAQAFDPMSPSVGRVAMASARKPSKAPSPPPSSQSRPAAFSKQVGLRPCDQVPVAHRKGSKKITESEESESDSD